MAAFIDNCGFVPTAGGTTDWTYSSTVGGYQSPAQANAVNGAVYVVRAQSSDLTQWEYASGAYNAATSTFARTAILYNSAGTGTMQSGSGTKINFASVPGLVAVVAMAEDVANATRTRTVLTSGSGTYNTKLGCRSINVRMVGGGGGGGGGGNSSSGGGSGSAGGTTTFGTSFLVANGGSAGGGGGNASSSGGAASSGDINITGQNGASSAGAGGASSFIQGSPGGNAPLFAGGGTGGWPGQVGANGIANTGGGGGGGGGGASGFTGAGGAGGGYCEKLIVSPASSYAYAVGGPGGGGAAGGGSGASSGGSGGSGIIIIDEFY